ncbi:hypothetical protein [Dyella mobilis]|uniref:Uncharacterized protein n=1 Tax=Dyella mobilis TaxID=1849582 RepID=A0ABS2KHG0_9GAMM|nr:hypothetical protein [Dyella mobilis]MBM7129803.1 hypothetical protein [Dyella mobilis]GLQ97934.1 hypothetical protein GCM10007863_23540 [Dyella mobilis]
MSSLIDRIVKAYRPLYLRGLLMDGQYRLSEVPKEPPVAGKRVVTVRPAFEPGRRRVLVASAVGAAASVCAGSIESAAVPAQAKAFAKRRA